MKDPESHGGGSMTKTIVTVNVEYNERIIGV